MSELYDESDTSGGATQLPPYPDRFYIAAQYAAVPGTVEADKSAVHPIKKFTDLTKLLLYSLFQQVNKIFTIFL